MSATDIIERIKSLPPNERREVYDFCRSADAAPEGVQYIPEDQFKDSMEKVLNEYDNLFRKLAQ